MISVGIKQIPPLSIKGEIVERVSEYKYLGTVIDDNLKFSQNTCAIYKKCQSRIYCLQKLRRLHVNKTVMNAFYRCFIESVLTFGFLSWFGGLSVKNRNVLNKVVRVCGRVIGVQQKSLTELYETRVVSKARYIMRDTSHILAKHYVRLPSGRRVRTMKFSTVRAKTSFVPASIDLINKY